MDEPAEKIAKLEHVQIDEFVKLEVVNNDEVQFSNVKEEILTEDDNNIVGIISGLDDCKDMLEEDLDDPGLASVDVKVKIEESNKPINIPQKTKRKPPTQPEIEEIDIKTAFTDQEDFALHALDLLSPYDINFISSHLARRTDKDIERRLDDNVFRKKYFLFQKIPSFLFGLTFNNNKLLKFRSLVLLSESLISNLICVTKTCSHGSDIPELTIEYDGKTKLGADINVFVEFINENAPPRFKKQLTMTADRLEQLFVDSKLSFHRYGTAIGHVYTKIRKSKSTVNIKKKESPIEISSDKISLTKEHELSLIKIVSAVGKTRWDMVVILLNEIFGKIKARGLSKMKVDKLLGEHYLKNIDPDLQKGAFTEDEDKCLLFLHKHFYQACSGNLPQVWRSISRHMAGRDETQCRERLLRKSTNKDDLTLDNLDLEDIHDDVPSLFYYNECQAFALTVIPKNEDQDLDIPTKLQHETRFLVVGTLDEIFILPCKETALRCSHQGLHTMNFTYNPAKPAAQFETYLKLTFANHLKRQGYIDEELAKTFNFSQINYTGKSIHDIMTHIMSTRFVIPREHFITVNQKEDEKITGGKRGFCNEKCYKTDDDQ